MSDEVVPIWPETLLQATAGMVPVVGGAVQPLVANAMARDQRRNAELAERLNAELDQETLCALEDDAKVSSFVLRSLDRAKGVAWRQQRERLVDVVAYALKEHEKGSPTAIDESELLVSALMEMTPTLIAGLVSAIEMNRRVIEYREAKKAAHEGGGEPPVFVPGDPLPDLVEAKLVSLGLLVQGPTTYGQTRPGHIPSPAARTLLDLCSPMDEMPVYD